VDTTSSTWELNRKEVAEGCKGMDALIFPLFTAVDAFQIAEAYKIPCFGVFSVIVVIFASYTTFSTLYIIQESLLLHMLDLQQLAINS
jgi:hypothetical protein